MLTLCFLLICFVFLNGTATTGISTYFHILSLHDALPIWSAALRPSPWSGRDAAFFRYGRRGQDSASRTRRSSPAIRSADAGPVRRNRHGDGLSRDRKSTRLNSSH